MKELFRKYQLIASLALGSAPVAVLIFLMLGPELLPWAWIYPVAYGIFCILAPWIPGKGRLFYGVMVSAAALALSLWLAGNGAWVPVLLTDACYLALFFWSLMIFRYPPAWELPDLLRLVCGGLHMIAQFAVYMDRSESRFLLTEQAPGLHAAFVAFLFLLPFSMNRVSVNKASAKHRPVPDGMRHKNTWMTAALVALAGLMSFIPYIFEWFKKILLWLVTMLAKLLQFSPVEQQGTQSAPVVESSGEMVPVVEETSLVAEILEAAMIVLGVIVIIGLCVAALVLLLRKLKIWLADVWGRLEQYAAAVAEDYEDEITDIRKESLGERIAAKRRGAFWQREQIPAQPVENIRYRYRRLLRKHPQWTADTTARENMPRELAELYEKARYSNHAVTEKEAEQFHTGTKDLR